MSKFITRLAMMLTIWIGFMPSFSQAADTFANTGPLATGRNWHTSTLLPNGKVLVAGELGASGVLNTVKLYDPATDTGDSPSEAWRYQIFQTISNTGGAADNADPDHDGLNNVLERAFNLDPTQADSPILTADTGTSGLPLIRRTGQPPVISIQYLRQLRPHLHPAGFLHA